jgi:hypothetical protein
MSANTIGQRLERVDRALSLIMASLGTIAASDAAHYTVAVPGDKRQHLYVSTLCEAIGAAAVEAQEEIYFITEGAPDAMKLPAPTEADLLHAGGGQ